ncbi:ribonuclease P protein component [Adhaeribacter arboris]|uniref:Ribonuclease P protein component n=1 Tax=Adhaeribacter arboris TaxID=2072846 RepID=A0A2T2YIW8_9BACT|nr:ribonuclease P protein component [Adhaeribacter arboris]PSR55448.1 ribonuclease P protein component [Adhaeribacter arboris]
MNAASENPAENKNIHNFTKEERLRSTKLIEQLFREGSSFNLYPLRFVYLKPTSPMATTPQVLISVSKRNFKKAVDRNRLKRQIREAYRLHKGILLSTGSSPLQLLGILYIAKEKKPFKVIQKKLISGLERFLNE